MKENLPNDDEDNILTEKSNTEKLLNEEITLPENDEDFTNLEETEKKSCCCSCCFYLFCCCLCHPDIKSNDFYRKNWKNYLFKEGSEASDLPFNKLTNLFANADDEAIEALGDFRLNPNLVNENKLRNDLEFYIPQLCTFLLFGDIKAIEEFFSFLCKACNASFFFAHRVHWFLSAMINAAEEKRENIINILRMVNTVNKSPTKKTRNKIDKFYISNSEEFIKYIQSNNLYFLYDSNLIDEKINIFEKINYNDLNGYQQELFNKYKRSRDIIIDFSDKEYQRVKQAEEDKKTKRKDSKKSSDSSNNIEKKNTGSSANLDINNEININQSSTLQSNYNSSEYKLKPSEFLISVSNFKLTNLDLTYEEDDDLEFDKEGNDDTNKIKIQEKT